MGQLNVERAWRPRSPEFQQESSEMRSYRKGLEGEIEVVAKQLSQLDKCWLVLHSITISSSGTDIDHLVIGPGGVFTLNTKNHDGCKVWVAKKTFMVNGQRNDYLQISRSEGIKASRILSRACNIEVTVEPVIVVLAAKFDIASDPCDVHVVARNTIRSWLECRPSSLTLGQVRSIYERARDSTTWLAE
jgi:hypothetical protein